MESLASLSTTEIVNRAFAEGMIQVKEEITAFCDFLRERQPRNMLEIGSESGGTFYLWCQLVSGLKISLDLPNGASGSWRFIDPQLLAERNQKMLSWAPNVRLLTGDSHDLAMQQRVRDLLGSQTLDLLFIDGDHSYEGVKQDFEMYREFVTTPGGLIAFHDIQHLGPQQLWAELGGNKREFNRHLHWAGIGVIEL